MCEEVKALRVAWYSLMELPEQKDWPSRFEFVQVTDGDTAGDVFDLVVMDVQAFADLDHLRSRYAAHGLPAVIIVDTTEQETAALTWLERGDEICRRDAVAGQLGVRLTRHAQHITPRPHINLDQLTGVANRRGFEEYVDTQITKNDAAEPLCLIFLDLDRLKEINDRIGYAGADQFLREVVQLLVRYAMGTGFVGRWGGDEFAILMRCNLEQATAFAEFLRDQIALHEFRSGGEQVRITASFGVVSGIGHTSVETLLDAADRCLYAAKQQGRNRVVTGKEFDALADAAGQDALIADFENRIQVTAARMISSVVLKARRLASRYRSEADHDGLTEIFNRRYLDRLLPRELEKARNEGRCLAIALLDLDHFGEINKAYGFPTGDRALKAVSQVLQRSVRAGDWVARYGGEEFCIVMPDTTLEAGSQVAERIRASLSKEAIKAYDGRQFRVTGSIGVVELLQEDADAIALYQRVSNRVHEAKLGGRNQVRS